MSPSIFLWHHPADSDHVQEISEALQAHGIEIFYRNSEDPAGEFSFSSVEWRLDKCEIVIFLLSGESAKASWLGNDILKVMREGDITLIPAILDDEGAKNIPILLKFMERLDFRQEISKVLEPFVDEVKGNKDTKFQQKGEKIRLFRNPIQWAVEHFRRYLTLRPLTFCWQITIENLIVSLAVSGLILLILQPDVRTNLETLTAGRFLWLVIILGPILETIILQAIPVFLARMFKVKFFGQILISVLPFAVLHFSRSVGTGIGAGIIGGFYSAFTYVHWRQKSLWTAFWVTALSHCLYNLAVFAMIIGEY
jgi:hypothetical protein